MEDIWRDQSYKFIHYYSYTLRTVETNGFGDDVVVFVLFPDAVTVVCYRQQKDVPTKPRVYSRGDVLVRICEHES